MDRAWTPVPLPAIHSGQAALTGLCETHEEVRSTAPEVFLPKQMELGPSQACKPDGSFWGRGRGGEMGERLHGGPSEMTVEGAVPEGWIL